jgi:hypothetical protein
MADKKPNRPPLKRIYFDINALFRWPNAANNLISPMRLANWLDIELRLAVHQADEAAATASCIRSNLSCVLRSH